MTVTPSLPLDLLDFDLQTLAQLLVERTQRLIHQKDRGVVNDRARECHALLLPATQLTRHSLFVPGETYQFDPRATRSRIFALACRRTRNGKARFSNTVRSGNSA